MGLVMDNRSCKGIKLGGGRCLAAPGHESDFCFWHDPERAEEAEQARKLGGTRRRREATLEGAYDLGPLDSVHGIRRVVEIAVMDTLGLENSVPRNRTLASLSLALAKLLEVGEQEERLTAIEAALGPRLQKNDTARRTR